MSDVFCNEFLHKIINSCPDYAADTEARKTFLNYANEKKTSLNSEEKLADESSQITK